MEKLVVNRISMNEQQHNPYIIPLSIIVSGVLVAAAVMYTADSGSRRTTAQVGAAVGSTPPPSTEEEGGLDAVRPVGAQDHILGNPSASVVIVEYSDTECPFCKQFHKTMRQVMDEYGKDGKVAWVYRHFPLDQLHSKARNEAVAMECANELGGSDTFWVYTDRLYEITPSNDNLDPAELPKIAQYAGLNVEKFTTCLTSGKFAKRIEDDVQNAIATGGRGTPYSIVIAADGTKTPVNGAVPYATLKAQIEQALGK